MAYTRRFRSSEGRWERPSSPATGATSPPVEPLLERDLVRAMAHITGGGFGGNIPRVLPPGLGVRIRKGSWPVLPIFRLIAEGGKVGDEEMHQTFNMGLGMLLVVRPGHLHEVEHSLERQRRALLRGGLGRCGSGVEFEG